MNPIVTLIIGIVAFLAALVIGVLVGVAYRKKVAEAEIGSAEAQAKKIVEEGEKLAETKKKEALLEAKEEILRHKNESERELKERRKEISKMEKIATLNLSTHTSSGCVFRWKTSVAIMDL